LREKVFLVEEKKFYPIIRGENWRFFSLGKTSLVKLEGQFLLENGCQINFACSFPHHYLPYVVETGSGLSLTNTQFKNKAGFSFFKSLIGINSLFTFILFTSFIVYHVWVLGMDSVKELREEIERVKEEKLQEALEKETTLEPTLPEKIPYSFADVGGYEEVKKELGNAARIIRENLSIWTPRGFVLYGPPGTGKTMIAEAFAKESGLPFFSTNGEFLRAGKFREMMQMSANKVISVFNGAVKYSQEKGSRVILFIDEIDDMDQEYPRREGGKELRKVMGGGEKTQKYDNVIVICTTNSIKWFHESVLRWKRLEKQFEIGYPNEKELSCIIDLYINKQKKGNIKEELDKEELRNKILEKVKDSRFTGASVSRLFELLDYTSLNLGGEWGGGWDWPVFEKTIEDMKKHGAMNVE
jgi:SpoVK/Ycf46/Vps4 family AAA+-type ATPase